MADQALLDRAVRPKQRTRAGHGHPWLTLVAVALGVMMVGLDATVVSIANPAIAKDLNADIGIWGATVGISIASGPIVAGLLVENVNWQSVFFLNAPLGVIALLMSLWVIRESKAEEAQGRFDVAGIVLLTGALFGLVW